MRKKRIVTTGIILGLSLSACSGGGTVDSGAGNEGGTDSPEEFTVAYNAQPPSLDPMATTAVATRVINRNFYEPLVSLDSDGQVQPVLAEGYEVSEDGLTVTFTLRENVPFHDGSTMEAADVVASLEYWMERSTVGQDFFSGASVETGEENSVVLNLPEPMYVVMDLLANQAQLPVIRPKEIVEDAPAEGVEEHVGTGPYQLSEWVTDQYVELERFDDYQSPEGESDGTVGAKEAHFGTMLFRFVDDPSTRMSGLQTGEYDAAVGIPWDNAEMMQNEDSVDLHSVNDVYNYIVFNKADGPMADQNMRQAILAAIDPDQIQQAAYVNDDFYSTTPGIMPSGSPWHFDSDPAHVERRDSQDQEEIDELLNEAGYEGETLRIMTTRDYVDYYDAGVVLSQQLEQAGINNELVVTDWATIVQDRDDPGAWEMFTGGSAWVAIPPLYPWMSPEWAGWTNDEDISAGMDGIINAEDEDAAHQAAEDLQHAVDDYLPLIKFGDRATLTALSTDFQGYDYLEEAGEIFYHVRPAD